MHGLTGVPKVQTSNPRIMAKNKRLFALVAVWPLSGLISILVKPQRKSLGRAALSHILRGSKALASPNPKKTSTAVKLGPQEIKVGRRDWVALSEIARRRREFEIDHEVAGLEVRNLAANQKFCSQWDSALCFDAVRLCQSVGLFVVSLEFQRRGLVKFEAEVRKFWGTRKTLGLAQIAIQTGNTELAGECLSRLSRDPLTPHVPSVRTVAEYLAIWLDGKSGRDSGFSDASDEQFSSMVKGRSVHLVGPADSGEIESLKQTNSVTVGILRPTGTNEVSAGNTKVVVPTLAYSNFSTMDFLGTLDQVTFRKSLSAFSTVVFKTSVPAEIQKHSSTLTRVASPLWSLFMYGQPNMAQVAAIDLLRFAPAALFVSGVNFFISGYREDQRWYDHRRSVLTDTSSSAGGAFEICSAVGHHGAIENRNVLRNLRMHNRLVGDKSFEFSLSLTTEQYLNALEIRYGRNGI